MEADPKLGGGVVVLNEPRAPFVRRGEEGGVHASQCSACGAGQAVRQGSSRNRQALSFRDTPAGR